MMTKEARYFPRWRQTLAASLHKGRSKPQSKYFQFANVGLDGFAQNRTLVFRGFSDNSNELLAITDRRSKKYKECTEHPYGQIAWYFANSREQYRISCKIKLLDADANEQDLRNRLWTELSENARSQFYWPTPLGAFSDDQADLFDVEHAENESQLPSSNFVVLVLSASYVDYLDLKTNPQTRETHKLLEADSEASILPNTTPNIASSIEHSTETSLETSEETKKEGPDGSVQSVHKHHKWEWSRVNP